MVVKQSLKLLAAVLLALFLAPALWAGTKKMTASGTISAIDTLTVRLEGNDGTFAVNTIIRGDTLKINAGQPASLVLDSLAIDAANFAPFGISHTPGSDTVEFIPPEVGNISRVIINGAELTGSMVVNGVTYKLLGATENVPALTWYALGLLALLMAVSVWWFFRRKPAPSTG